MVRAGVEVMARAFGTAGPPTTGPAPQDGQGCPRIPGPAPGARVDSAMSDPSMSDSPLVLLAGPVAVGTGALVATVHVAI